MARYRLTKSFTSSLGPRLAGEVIEITEVEAAWILRASPGVLEPLAEARDVETPPHDRMMRQPQHRRTARVE